MKLLTEILIMGDQRLIPEPLQCSYTFWLVWLSSVGGYIIIVPNTHAKQRKPHPSGTPGWHNWILKVFKREQMLFVPRSGKNRKQTQPLKASLRTSFMTNVFVWKPLYSHRFQQKKRNPNESVSQPQTTFQQSHDFISLSKYCFYFIWSK